VTLQGKSFKILLTGLIVALMAGAVSGLEITDPNDGAANNSELEFNVSVDSGNYENIGLEIVNGGVIASSGSLSSVGEYVWQSGDTYWSNGTYPVRAFNDSSGAASASIDVIIDESADNVTSISADNQSDGSIELSLSWETEGDSSPAYLNITREEEESGNKTYFKKTSIDSSFVDTQTQFKDYKYSATVIDEAGNRNEALSSSTGYISVTDGVSPAIQIQNPADDSYISSTSPEIQVDVSDDLAGLKNASIVLDDQEQNITGLSGDKSTSLDLSTEDLEEEKYEPEVVAHDTEDNRENVSWTFTVDTTGPSPSASLTPDPDEQEYLSTETPIGVEVDSGDVGSKEVARVVCYVDDPSDYGYDFGESSTYEDGSFRCGDLNPAEYSGGDHNVYAQFYDEAGNREEQNLGEYTFDTESPEIDRLDISPEYTNKEPNVTVEGADAGSGLQDAEYMFSDNVEAGQGSGISAGFEDDEFVFNPNLRNKEDGDYTLYVRVQDGSGKWSETSSNDFTLNRGALPDPQLSTDELNITSGSSTDFEVTVHNDGKVPLMGAELSFRNGFEGSRNDIDVSGESSETYTMQVSTNESFRQTQATLELVASTVSRNITVPVNVQASESQMEEVDSQIREYNGKLSELRSDLSRLEEQGASEELLDQMRTEIDEYDTKLQSVKSAAKDNEYYEIASELDEVDTRHSEAVNTTSQVEQEYRSNQRQKMMILAFILILGLLGGGAFLYYRSNYYIDMENLPASIEEISSDFDWDETVDNLEDKLNNLLEAGEENGDDSEDVSWS